MSTGTGSGLFVGEGQISAFYGDNSPGVDLAVHAPYSETGSLTFLCNGFTKTGTTDELSNPVCNEGGTALGGVILPGNVSKTAPGQTIDFTCRQVGPTFSTTVSGTLTSR